MRRIKQIWIPCFFVVLRLPSGPEIVKNELPENESPEGDVRVSLTGNMLNSRGKKRKEIRGTNGHPYLWERTDDVFQQPFRIFAGADPDCMTAKFSDNVLKTIISNSTGDGNEKTDINSAWNRHGGPRGLMVFIQRRRDALPAPNRFLDFIRCCFAKKIEKVDNRGGEYAAKILDDEKNRHN